MSFDATKAMNAAFAGITNVLVIRAVITQRQTKIKMSTYRISGRLPSLALIMYAIG